MEEKEDEIFETLQDKKVALYVRKEKGEEITTSGYGRLQWIEGCYKGACCRG